MTREIKFRARSLDGIWDERTDKCFDHWFCIGADYNIFNK